MSRLADIRDSVLVALACLVAGVVVLWEPVIGVPLCALALSWLTYKRGPMLATAVAIVATALLAIQQPVGGLLLGPVLLVVGPYAATALRKRSPWEIVGVVTAVTALALFGSAFIDAAASHMDVTALTQKSLMAGALSFAQATGTATAASSAATAELTRLTREWALQWPAWLGVTAALIGLLVVYAVGRSAKTLGVTDARALPPLAELDLSFHLTWGAIGGLALMAVGQFSGRPDGILGVIGVNVMRVIGVLLALQGFAVFAGLYRKAKLGVIGRVLGYAFLLFTELATARLVPVGLVGLTGLIDLWVNLRKLPRDGVKPLEEPVGRA